MKYKVDLLQVTGSKSGVILNTLAGLLIATELFAIGMMSYLGTFSRYISDDYCEAVITRGGSILPVVFRIYTEGIFRGTNRYAKFLFLTLAERLGNVNIQVLPALMILVWLIGLVWSINQLRKLAGIRLPFIMDCLAATSIVFFSVWQAPSYYQTLLWRSGMATHFAPIAFMPLLSGFVLRQINVSEKPVWWKSAIVFLVSFLVGGFSEPPAAFMVVFVLLSMIVVWRWDDGLKRRTAINLMSYTLIGTMFALVALFFAPGNLSFGNSSYVDLIIAFGTTFKYAFEFLVDTLKTLPLPSLISLLIPFLMAFGLFTGSDNQPGIIPGKRRVWMWFILVLLTQYLLIAASFAPSAYGQSYPADRARFLGRFVMTGALMLEGALLGILCAQYGMSLSRRGLLSVLGMLALFVLAVYPLRAGLTLHAEVPEYREWASAWDLREAKIYKDIEMGEKDLVVNLLSSRESVKEIDPNFRHWVNRCAAEYYGVNTIHSASME